VRRRPARVVAYWLMVWLAIAPLLATVGCALTCTSDAVVQCCAGERHEHLSGEPASSHECPSCVICHPPQEQPAQLSSLEWVAKPILHKALPPLSDFTLPYTATFVPLPRVDEVAGILLHSARLYLRAPPLSELA